jgi:hypothetical protein
VCPHHDHELTVGPLCSTFAADSPVSFSFVSDHCLNEGAMFIRGEDSFAMIMATK